MELVVDTNVIFSFFKKDSTPKELILDPELKYGLKLFSPKLILEEVKKHKYEICSKFSVSPDDFDIMFSSLPLFVKIAKRDFFKEFSSKAEEILPKHIKDIPFVALCLSFKNKGYNIGLWSNEEGLKILEKYGIKVFSTSKLVKYLKSLGHKF